MSPLVLVLALCAGPPDASSSVPSKADAVVVEPLTTPDDVKGLRATFRVHAAPDAVLETLWDVAKFRSIFPDIHQLEVLAKRDNEVDAKFTVDAVLATVTYTLRRDVDRTARTVVWKNIGGDLKYVRGSWTVRAVDGKPDESDVIYTSFVDVGTFVPQGMVRDIAMSKVNEMTVRVRRACAQSTPRIATAPVPTAAVAPQ